MTSAKTPTGEKTSAFLLSDQTRKLIFIAAASTFVVLHFGYESIAKHLAPIALLTGLILAQIIGVPYSDVFKKHKVTGRLLQYSVVGLGFGMSVTTAIKAGTEGGMVLTITSIFGTMLFGILIGMMLKIDRKTTQLISSGTAICGGSAIAAVSPVIHAEDKQISVAIGIVFILNSVALFVFPPLGHYFGMTGHQFGLWSAVAIHDTSSVVGAASSFGENALDTATPVKLFRALWIIPLALGTSFFFKGEQKIKIPWFIGFFILAIIIRTYVPGMDKFGPMLVNVAKVGLVLTLFFIGSSLSLKTIRSVGFRPLLLGILLWLMIGSGSLYYILHFVK
jgi:uncharacterized integral membrane protein (TIGR00698 family)